MMRCLLLDLLLASAVILFGRQLPVKTYTTADGLPRNIIRKIVADSHGYLWFCTDEGLSRFDGYSFTNYTRDQGLPSDVVFDLLETTRGGYWIGTAKGACWFRPDEAGLPPSERFTIYHSRGGGFADIFLRLFEDTTGPVWAGTAAGLYRLSMFVDEFEPVNLGMPNLYARPLVADGHGNIWVGTIKGLFRRAPNGSVQRYTTENGLPANWITALLRDRQGRFWAGIKGVGLCLLASNPVPDRRIVIRTYTTRDGLAGDQIRAIFQSRDEKIWTATNGGLSVLLPGSAAAGEQFQNYTSAEGLSESGLIAVTEDHEGNLWVGSESGGATRIARNGFITYGPEDGLRLQRLAGIFETRSGQLVATTWNGTHTELALNYFDGRRFHAVSPNFGPAVRSFPSMPNEIVLQDHTGEWWFATTKGLCRFPAVPITQLARTRPKAIYRARTGFSDNPVDHVFEDSRGDIWIATNPSGRVASMYGLRRWRPSTQSFDDFLGGEFVSRAPHSTEGAQILAEDHFGNMWIALDGGGLVRYRGGRFTQITSNGPIGSSTEAIYADRAGRLWIGDNENGLTRIDAPDAEQPAFVHYGRDQGLSSNSIGVIAEDLSGRIYVGTGRGVDQLDPITNRIKHYTVADGLVKGELEIGFRDRQGALWFGTQQGVSQFVPEPDRPVSAAEIRLSSLRIRGTPYPIADLGETIISGLTLSSNQNELQIEFNGLGFYSGDLYYQYMLEGADREWSAPSNQRSVNYASLSPGRYRFLARAATTGGSAVSKPAALVFRILPPIWLRWWFLTSVDVAGAAAIYAVYRYRLGSILELERLRMRIATDLHDDIGASLSQVALLSEVAGRQIDGDARAREPLEQIGAISRQLVDSMSDIVWSINPKRDTLGDLTQRMRAFASDVFPARNIAFSFHAPDAGQNSKLAIEARRQVFLIFKESVNNVVRHSQCCAVDIDFRVEEDWLVLKLNDNGKGFESRQMFVGHGLVSMGDRARKLGGDFQAASSPQGTTVTLRVPLARGPQSWRKKFLHRYVGGSGANLQ
jgi:ligand-binding sensor domain-containing protein/two-component sensor histidine kinase